MGTTREEAERHHDALKLRALDSIEAAVAAKRLVLTERDRLLVSLAAEAGIIAAIDWMCGQ